MDMRTIRFTRKNRSNDILHIETEGCIINIQLLYNHESDEDVTVIAVQPEETWTCPEPHVVKLAKERERKV